MSLPSNPAGFARKLCRALPHKDLQAAESVYIYSTPKGSPQPATRKKGLSQAACSLGKPKGSTGLHHPLGLLLDELRSAEASWLQQKAELRRAMESHKKRADKAEFELNKLQVILSWHCIVWLLPGIFTKGPLST